MRMFKQKNKKNIVFIIAEAGINHNGDIRIAKEMINEASRVSADAIKFQTFIAEKAISKYAPKAEYQKALTDIKESQLEMAKKWEFNLHQHKELFDCCLGKDILFLSSPFDLESIDLLKELGLGILKIPSGEITNLPYLRKIGALNKEIILSTGMSDLGEIEDALNVLVNAGTQKENITVLHCNTEYPSPYEDVHLRAMLTIREAFDVKVGYSDHTLGIEVPIAAVALGATVIEKHFTLDKRMEGPDHIASLEPSELEAMIIAIRNIEKALGSRIKKPSPSELKNRPIVRKSIVAAEDIIKGDVFTEECLTVKRPGTGLNPMFWDIVIGKTAKKNFKKDELVDL